MPDQNISLDEYLDSEGAGKVSRRHFARENGTVIKMARGEIKRAKYDPATATRSFVMSAEVEDRDRDIVVQAGLDLTEFLKNPVALWAHNSREPIGKWKNITPILTGRPKRTEGDCVLTIADPLAQRVSAHWEADSLSAVSIGFMPREIERRDTPEDKRDDYFYYAGYMIHAAELYECSVCSIPANPAALAKAAKDGDTLARELIEQVLDTWTKQNGLLMPRKHFEEANKMAGGHKHSITINGVKFVSDGKTDENGMCRFSSEKAGEAKPILLPAASLPPAAEPSTAERLEAELKEPGVVARVLKALGIEPGKGAEPPQEDEAAAGTKAEKEPEPETAEAKAARAIAKDLPAIEHRHKLFELDARAASLDSETAAAAAN